jgi:hypothetical protein
LRGVNDRGAYIILVSVKDEWTGCVYNLLGHLRKCRTGRTSIRGEKKRKKKDFVKMKGKKDDTSVIDNRPISNLLSIKYKLNQNGYYFTRGEIPLFPVMKYR